MRIRASAIIRYKGKIILIKREKGYGESKITYYVIPGGGVEMDEDVKTATHREIEEEIGIKIKLSDEFYHLENEEKNEYFFIADYESGEIGTGTGPEFTSRDYEKYGSYEVVLVEKEKINNLNLLPPEIKEYIMNLGTSFFSAK